MPCASALVENVTPLSPDQEIGEVLEFLQNYHLSYLPVVDEDGILLGHFSLHLLLKNLLPVSLNIKNTAHQGTETMVRAAPGIAKRLRKVKALKVQDLMERRVKTVYPDTPLWEGVAEIVEQHAPVMVVERETNKFLGMMNRRSALLELERMQQEEDE